MLQKDTIQLQQRDLDYLRKQLSTIQKEHLEEERRLLSYKKHLEEKVNISLIVIIDNFLNFSHSQNEGKSFTG